MPTISITRWGLRSTFTVGGDIEFKFFDEVKLEVVKQKYSGVWLLADNGYNEELCAIPPYKTPLNQQEKMLCVPLGY